MMIDFRDLARWCSGPRAGEDGSNGYTCNRCDGGYSVDRADGCEPTGLCHDCAQIICLDVVPLLLVRLAQLERLVEFVAERDG
jgi:hypothetical protein